MANASASAKVASSCRQAQRLAFLRSPTNHPGSFRCSRHRTRHLIPSSSFVRASQQHATAPGVTGIKSCRTTSTGRPVLRAHAQRLLARPPSPSSGGRDHRRCREFKPRLSRLGRLAAVSS